MPIIKVVKNKGSVPDDKKGQSGAHGREELPQQNEDPIIKAESAHIFKNRMSAVKMKAEHRERYKKVK